MLEWEGLPWRYLAMRMLLVPLLAALLPSCSLFKSDEEIPAESKTKPRLVGRVAQIPSGSDFLLIESYGNWEVPDGGLLSGVGTEGRTSNLVATGEKLGQFAAADIRSGLAKIGDSVYYRPIADSNSSPEIGSPAAEGEGDSKIEAEKRPAEPPAKP
jgi:hypothetical protein